MALSVIHFIHPLQEQHCTGVLVRFGQCWERHGSLQQLWILRVLLELELLKLLYALGEKAHVSRWALVILIWIQDVSIGPPWRSGAGSPIQLSWSWRTRHLRIRHAYVMDRVKSGGLYVQHLAGEDQPADLPTKLHSKARLLHLLGTWGMIGLAGLNEKKGLQCLKLGCVFLLLLAIQSLAVSAAKEPLPTVGTMELFALLILTCISAVALWEAGKALGTWAYPRLFGSKRERKIRKLKELARIAAEAEIEKWMDEDEVPSSERVLQAARDRATRTATTAMSGPTRPRTTSPSPSPTTELSPREAQLQR